MEGLPGPGPVGLRVLRQCVYIPCFNTNNDDRFLVVMGKSFPERGGTLKVALHAPCTRSHPLGVYCPQLGPADASWVSPVPYGKP